MANPIYVWSGSGASSPDGSSWANAYTTIEAGLTAAVSAGAPLRIADDHVPTAYASVMTLTAGASQAALTAISCVNRTSGALSTMANPITTQSGVNLTLAGYAKCFGVPISLGAGTTSSASLIMSTSVATDWTFEGGSLKLNNTNSSGIGCGAANRFPYRLALINTPLIFMNAGQTVNLYGELVLKGAGTTIYNSGISGSVAPSTLITPQGFNTLVVNIEGVDLSSLSSGGKFLFAATAAYAFKALIKDCKTGALPTLANLVSGGTIASATRIDVVRSGPSGTAGNFIEQRHSIEGSQVDEATITLTGGASDGTTLKSRKIVTGTSASVAKPFEGSTVVIWNANASQAMTVALQGIWDAAAVPNDNDVWIEVEYLADANDPLGGYVSSNLSTAIQAGNALAAGTGTWTTTGLSAPKKFVLTSPTFTPAQAGFLTIRLFVAKAGTFYVDPKPVLTIGGSAGPAISRSLVLPSGALMHETGAVTQGATVTQVVPMIRYRRR